MQVFGAVLVVIGDVMCVAGIVEIIGDEVRRHRDGQRRARRAIEAEWRIHQIASDAKARLWDEAKRHGSSGG